MKKLKNLILTVFILPLLYGCPLPGSLESVKKQEVRDELIVEIQKQITELGKTPITEDQAKYKGKLDKDKYIISLRKQLNEIKDKKKQEKTKLEDTKKAENKKLDRKKAIQKYKGEITILGETPLLEFEIGSEDKYLIALKKQFDLAKKIKREEEQKIAESIPDWYQDMPIGTEAIMFARGTAISSDLQFSEDKAVNASLIALAKKLQNRLDSKNKLMIKEAGLGEDLTLKTNIERASTIVIKNVTVSGYKIIKTKMTPRSQGGYRTYILVEYPISLTYKNYLEEINKSTELTNKLTALKNTQAYRDLVDSANTYVSP
jgi:hypothetical protein